MTLRAHKAGVVLPDFKSLDLGTPDADEAIAGFESFAWAEQIARCQGLDAEGITAAFPSMTFRIGTEHIAIDATDQPGVFSLEICLRRPKRVLGIFRAHKFHVLPALMRGRVGEMIQHFYALGEDRHSYFRRIQRQLRTAGAA
jgi:hypothetical protein